MSLYTSVESEIQRGVLLEEKMISNEISNHDPSEF